MIPKDPMILLSYVNTQLRDYYDSLEALCTLRGIKKEELIEKLDMIDYHYDEELNKFVLCEKMPSGMRPGGHLFGSCC